MMMLAFYPTGVAINDDRFKKLVGNILRIVFLDSRDHIFTLVTLTRNKRSKRFSYAPNVHHDP
jgi:hypothetical protein